MGDRAGTSAPPRKGTAESWLLPAQTLTTLPKTCPPGCALPATATSLGCFWPPRACWPQVGCTALAGLARHPCNTKCRNKLVAPCAALCAVTGTAGWPRHSIVHVPAEPGDRHGTVHPRPWAQPYLYPLEVPHELCAWVTLDRVQK